MFTDTIKIQSISNVNSINTSILSKRLTTLEFINLFPSNVCNIKGSKTFNFSLSPYYEAGLIKSITVDSVFDDVGNASINGISVGSCTFADSFQCYFLTISKNLNVKNLRKNNSITLYAEDSNASNCATTNSTYAKSKITINYK
jgi:hypothetical protein